jgi:hypothetical protein
MGHASRSYVAPRPMTWPMTCCMSFCPAVGMRAMRSASSGGRAPYAQACPIGGQAVLLGPSRAAGGSVLSNRDKVLAGPAGRGVLGVLALNSPHTKLKRLR